MTRPIEPLTQPADLDLKKLNQRFEKSHPKDILTWSVVNVPEKLIQVSAFNVDDMLITDLLYRAIRPKNPVPVLFLDTLHHFNETLELVAHANEQYRLNLKVCRPKGTTTPAAFSKKYGKALWKKNPVQYSQLTQVEPLERGLNSMGAIAWITARRREQSPKFANIPIFELDQNQRLIVNPLANWTRTETWAYVFEHDVIYNPLHDKGYPKIGDEPTTTPIIHDSEAPGHDNMVLGKP